MTRKITRGVARIARGLDSTITLGNLDAKRDWGWAPDYADAILRSATTTGDYIVATGRTHSVRDFVDTAFAAAGITDWVRHIVQDARFMRSSDAPVLCGDATHARESLGWIPSVEFNEIVRRMVTADLAILDGGSEDQR